MPGTSTPEPATTGLVSAEDSGEPSPSTTQRVRRSAEAESTEVRRSYIPLLAVAALLVIAVFAWSPWGGSGDAGTTSKVPDAGAQGAAGRVGTGSPAKAAKDSVTVEVACTPRARLVDIEGVTLGETPMPLSLKGAELPYTLEFRRAGYVSQERRVTAAMLDSKGHVKLSVVLARKPGAPVLDAAAPDTTPAPKPDARTHVARDAAVAPADATEAPADAAAPAPKARLIFRKKKRKKKAKGGSAPGIKLER